MAINPGIVQGLQPMRSPLEREQRLMSLKNARLGQEQEETALESAQLQNQGTRQKFDAEGALKKVLAENPEAPDSELYRVAGPYAQPVIAQRRLEKKAKLEDQKAQFEMHAQMVNELGNGAYGIRQLPPEQRKPAHDALIQRMFQSGVIDEETTNDLLDDDLSDSGLDRVIATTPALKLQLEQAQKKVQNDLANVVKEIDTYTNAQGRRTTLFQRPDGSTYEHVGGEVQKPANTDSFEEQTYADYLKDTALIKKYGPNRIGFDKYKQDQRVDAAQASKTPAAPKPSSGVEKNAMGFYIQAKDALANVDKLESNIQSLGTFEQGKLKFAPNLAQSQIGQSYNQAQRTFTESRLRAVSGAAIQPFEYDNDALMYFAQPGDTKETLEQKKRSRQAVMEGLKAKAGRAHAEYYGEEGEPGASVKMQAPDGSVRDVPADQVEHFKGLGAKVVKK